MLKAAESFLFSRRQQLAIADQARRGIGVISVNPQYYSPASICNNSITGFSGTFSQPFGASHVNTGWVVGYGTEGHLSLMPGNWTWRIESLYMDLGHLNATGAFGPACVGNLCGDGGPVAAQVATNTHFTDWILRGGLNYRF